MRVTIEMPNGRREIGRIGRYQTAKRRAIIRLIWETAIRIESNAISRTPVDQGNLKRSMGKRPLLGGLVAEIFNTAEYAPHVEFGTRPHEIRPRTARLLSWMKNGRRFFARKVQHPGTRAQPFLFPAWEDNRQTFINRMIQELRRP